MSGSATKTAEIEQIFAYWQSAWPRRNRISTTSGARRSKQRSQWATRRLSFCKAIRGCSLTPHNMGKNEQGQKYNGLALIFRSADQIDRFIANDTTPPRAMNGHANGVLAHNESVMAAFLASDAPPDPMDIDMEHRAMQLADKAEFVRR